MTEVVGTRCGDAAIDVRYEGTILSDALQVGSGTLFGTALGGGAQLRQALRTGSSRPGSMNLFSGDKQTARLFDLVPDEPGTFTVGAHGDSTSIGYGRPDSNVNITASDLADMLARYKAYKGQDLRLVCCCTGQGLNSFGSRLARRTWLVVRAPSTKMRLGTRYPNGYVIHDFQNNVPGQWNTFSPFNAYVPIEWRPNE